MSTLITNIINGWLQQPSPVTVSFCSTVEQTMLVSNGLCWTCSRCSLTMTHASTCRSLSYDHPKRLKLAPERIERTLNLRALMSIEERKDIEYSDLHGFSCLLIVCGKGRMGDTFPETFSCLDLRVRTSHHATTFTQELGRLCRYPTTPDPGHQEGSCSQGQTALRCEGLPEDCLNPTPELIECQWTLLLDALKFCGFPPNQAATDSIQGKLSCTKLISSEPKLSSYVKF